MEKKILFVFLFVLTVGLVFSNSINITQPNGGVFKRSDTLHIVWGVSGINGNVKINLRKADGSGGITIIKSYPANRLQYNYKLSSVKPGKYFIKIKQGKVFGKSRVFSVVNDSNNTNGITMINTDSLYRPRVNEPVTLDPKYQIKPLTLDPKFMQNNKYGNGCPGAKGCTIKFINNTQLNIVALNIRRLDNNKIENPIANAGQVIPPGGYLNISEFYDKRYVYQAFYGQWNRGQAKPTFSSYYRSGPVSSAFTGNSRIVNIVDPRAKKPVNPFADAIKKLTVYKKFNDWKLVWFDYNKCAFGICNDILRIFNDGRFEYWEANSKGKYQKITYGTFKVTAYNQRTKIISFKLFPKNKNASFSEGQYSYSNTGIMGRMSLAIDVYTVTLGKRTACFGCR